MNNRKIEYTGFQASRDLADFLDKQLIAIQEQAPSGSFLKLDLKKERDQYICELAVNGIENRFLSTSVGDFITNAAIDVIVDMEKKLKFWKLMRFRDEHIQKAT